eukprot:scaffold70434_cov73-Phaeocystis_antarctica.AAC.5
MSAPARSRLRTHSARPFIEAIRRGVSPVPGLTQSGSVPSLSSLSRHAKSPKAAASCRRAERYASHS